jgi:murein DD-endopeptidase MepM/ murein hydrolase activator NlpD
MSRLLTITIILVIISAIPSYASVCDDWNSLEKEIRDNRIGRNQAKESIIELDRELLAAYAGKIGHTERHFPVKGYGSKSIGGRNGSGYRPLGYDFYTGNRHGGHPAHDLFIRDKKRNGLDSGIGKPAAIVAFADGVVIAVNPSWEYPSPIRGGKYIWIFNPEENRFYYYAHLEKLMVAPGDAVKAGETIALLGRTGKNARPKRSPTHLHFMCLSFNNGGMTPVNTYRDLLCAAGKCRPSPL